MDCERHTIYCRQLATFEMKADGEIFQLQNGVSHAESLLQHLRQGTKRHNSGGFWSGGCCTVGRLYADVKVKTCSLQAAFTARLSTSRRFPIGNVPLSELQ